MRGPSGLPAWVPTGRAHLTQADGWLVEGYRVTKRKFFLTKWTLSLGCVGPFCLSIHTSILDPKMKHRIASEMVRVFEARRLDPPV